MRHGKKFNHLSRKSAHRKAMLSNMACSLIEHKRIKTTLAKAKALRVYIEPLITKSKNDTTHSRRIAFSYLKQKEAITELFSDIATKVSDRQGGYTRILKLSNRLGDNAQMALIELVDYNEEYTTNKPKKSKSRRTRKKNLDQSTITESNKDNIIEDVTSSEIIDVATSENVEENIVEKKSSDVKDESNIKTEKEVTDAENKEEKGE
jgi:large subunit ribosomal protein L17